MSYFDTKQVLQKYQAEYFRCGNCGSIQIEDPFWLEEAYSNPELELKLDTGRFNRAKVNSKFVDQYINDNSIEGQFIDFGCGQENLFVKEMRQLGHDFYGYDKYYTNMPFYKDLIKCDMITSFEVFEHLTNPIETIIEMLGYTNIIMASTLMVDKDKPPEKDWQYFSLLAGQHIIFYSKESFQAIGELLNLNVDFYNMNSIYGNTAVLKRD